MGMWTKVANFFALRDEDEFEEGLFDLDGKPKVVPLREAKDARRVGVSLFHPRQYDDVMEIADNLRARMLVVVNLVGADRALSQRVVDFLSGAVYTLDGKMQRIAEGIYLFAPSNVQINATDPAYDSHAAYEAW